MTNITFYIKQSDEIAIKRDFIALIKKYKGFIFDIRRSSGPHNLACYYVEFVYKAEAQECAAVVLNELDIDSDTSEEVIDEITEGLCKYCEEPLPCLCQTNKNPPEDLTSPASVQKKGLTDLVEDLDF